MQVASATANLSQTDHQQVFIIYTFVKIPPRPIHSKAQWALFANNRFYAYYTRAIGLETFFFARWNANCNYYNI